ncbi:bidirectional hydrogenase complex protein HoxE [Calothrix sp. UHCC 0171]|uniref:bidirectional hydrogenase complex protein HoxE n=1 Tax=Calothrix sp. UHCC 0171 TaxID=3110245 RepID=UPI002B1EE0D8|nr:bidirectional hydrogenase complex protein HoxE [Calothrix sp. UHCC 0171]MEA5574367.1 bidirectional hydrogenase complex protein HoxE [Calothrix sp. UHCC 0171]
MNLISQQATTDNRLQILDATIKRYQYQQDTLIEVLHKAQELFGYLENNILLYIAQSLKLPPSQVYGVATFYHLFAFTAPAKHTCVVCTGTACYFQGTQAILANLEKYAHIHGGETTSDGEFSLFTARCIGTCGIAPVVVFDDTVLGSDTPENICDRIVTLLEQS